ncbi:MAG: hypothetical protein IJS46_04555 [Kiritimatiellae bacterium]|nr:hypothetical protein [Kiritimatiellia bacterium]
MDDAQPRTAALRRSSGRVIAERFAPRAIAFVPWLDALLLVVATFLFANATACIPATEVSLPCEPFADGVRPCAVSVCVVADRGASAGSAGEGAMLRASAFLGEERYDLGQEGRVEAFRRDLAQAVANAGEKRAMVYMDGALDWSAAHRVMGILSGCGVEKAFFAHRDSSAR